MKQYLDKIGTTGTLFGAFAAAPACCLPLLASVGASFGLGIFAPFNSILVYFLQFFVILAVIGSFFGFQRHQNWMPFFLSTGSAIAIIYAYNFQLSQGLIFSGLLGLVIAAFWNTYEIKKYGKCTPNNIKLEATITCPSCSYKQIKKMPTDSCLFFYECPNCKIMLKPKQGDCCVFCSFGSVKCPPIQNGSCPC